MPGRDYAQPWVQKALAEGLGPTAALRVAREGGLRIQDATWFKTFGQERSNLAIQARAIAEPLNRLPSADQIGQWTTVKKKGYAYRVVTVMVDKETGAESSRITTVTSDKLITRQSAILQAALNFSDPDEKYPQDPLSHFMAGVFEMVPEGSDGGDI